MMKVVETGRNPTMKHLGRAHRIPVAWLHERFSTHSDPVDMKYCESSYMAADIYTKAFTDGESWYHACALTNHVPQSIINEVSSSGVSKVMTSSEIRIDPSQVPSYIRRDRVQYAKKYVTLPSRLTKFWPFVVRRVTTDLKTHRVLADEDVRNLTNKELHRALPVVGSTDIKVEFLSLIHI